MTMVTFLRKNGVPFSPNPAHATTIVMSLAAGEVSEESLHAMDSGQLAKGMMSSGAARGRLTAGE
jgi:prophage maintenance system killer protein